MPRCRQRCAARRSPASTSRWSRAARPPRRGTIDAPLGRDRRVRTKISTDTDDPHHGDHALRDRARAARGHAAAGDARDRAHAPDPRAPAGDRPSGGRRPGVRPRGPPRAGPAVPARATARVRSSRDRGTHGAAGATAGGPGQGPPAGVRGTGRPIGVGEPGPPVTSPNAGVRRNFPKLSPHSSQPRAVGLQISAHPEAAVPARRIDAGSARPRCPGPAPSRTKEFSTMAEVGLKELLEAGVHFGHQTRRWNPKMRRFIHGESGGIYLIDLLKTQALLSAGAAVRDRDRPPRRHGPVRRHQEAGARRHQGDRHRAEHAVRQPPLARRPADELPDDVRAHQAPARPRALPGRRPALAAADA